MPSYKITFLPRVDERMLALPPETRKQLLQMLQDIAGVADSFVRSVEPFGQPPTPPQLHLGVGAFAARYEIDAFSRTITVVHLLLPTSVMYPSPG